MGTGGTASVVRAKGRENRWESPTTTTTTTTAMTMTMTIMEDDNKAVIAVMMTLADSLRSREAAHNPTDEPGVVPVGQIIPSAGPMAADRRRDVPRMMTAIGASPSGRR